MDFGFGAPVAHACERWLLRRYAHHLIVSDTRRGRRGPQAGVARWLVDHRALLGWRGALPKAAGKDDTPRLTAAAWKAYAPARARLATACDEAVPALSSLGQRITWLADALQLAPLDRAILGALARAALSRPLRDLIQRLSGYEGEAWYDEDTNLNKLAVMLAVPQARLNQRLQNGAPLRLYGLVEDRGEADFAPSAICMAALRLSAGTPAAMRNKLLGKSAVATLGYEAFAHIEGHDVATRLLAGALKARMRGVNILFYGAPGTGKSEFARALAKQVGARAVFAGETATDTESVEPTRAARIGSIALISVLARQAGKTFVVVDEADDIFTGVDESDGAARKGSKAFMNRLVEACEAPTIWITNTPQRLGPAILRRMNFVLRFPTPGRAVRARIVADIAIKTRLRLDARQRDELAALDAPPAIIANAMRTASLAGNDGALAVSSARATLRALRGPDLPNAPQPIAFDASLLNTDADLIDLRNRVAKAGELALSFCFHGLPGTGKSAFARHLAQVLGLDVLEKRASDILSMWVGGSEKAIRSTFEEAADTRAFLIFDEADSLLASREGAQRSWEVSQVNEMLVGMERHPLPFACTTNSFATLDPACLRRFLFKVKFLPMTEVQIGAAFQAAFALCAPADVLRLGNLTPGDFAVVARKAQVLGESGATALGQWLMQEAAAKPGGQLGRIGF